MPAVNSTRTSLVVLIRQQVFDDYTLSKQHTWVNQCNTSLRVHYTCILLISDGVIEFLDMAWYSALIEYYSQTEYEYRIQSQEFRRVTQLVNYTDHRHIESSELHRNTKWEYLLDLTRSMAAIGDVIFIICLNVYCVCNMWMCVHACLRACVCARARV